MKVTEIFYSIDGEGKRAGQLTAFIRLTGCNLRCSYCDTRFAYDGGINLPAEIIAESVKKYRNITLTGGEPLKQNCHELLMLLNRHEVNIETNGSIDLSEYLKYNYVFFTMDLKTPSSLMEDSVNYNNLEILRCRDVLKFVVGDKADLVKMRDIYLSFKPQAAVYVSPVYGKMQPSTIVDFMKENNLQDWKLQLQMHKIIWQHESRGV